MRETLKPAEVLVETSGEVSAEAVAEARERIAALARFTGRPILYARVNLGHSPDRTVDERCTVRAILDVNGHPLHAQAAAETAHLAIAEIQERLRTRLAKLDRHPSHNVAVRNGIARKGPATPGDQN